MTVYVTPFGKDSNTGITEQEAFASLQAAYDMLAAQHKSGTLELPAEIRIAPGEYQISKPLHFYDNFPVLIHTPEGTEKAVISGGTKITGWKKARLNGKSVLKAEIPAEFDDLPFLCTGGGIRRPAVWPKKDFLRIAKRADEKPGFATTPDTDDFFYVKEGDFNPDWHDPEGILIQMIHLWIEENLRIESFDAKTGKLTTATAICFLPHESNTEYRYFNVREALTEPGEFYFDRATHTVWRIPEPEENDDWFIPRMGSLVRIDSGAQWITLRNLLFRHAGGYLPKSSDFFDLRDFGFEPVKNGTLREKGFRVWRTDRRKPFYQAAQGAAELPGILMFDHASDCAVEECEVVASGWYAICFAEGCGGIAVRRCELHDLGGGGIFASGGVPQERDSQTDGDVSHLILTDNHIHDCGKIHHSAIGILLTFAHGCLLEHNHIHDLYYSGISCGWTWGYGESITYENRIGWNRIHDLGKGILSDMGGIYLLGIQPGTRVYHNVIYNIDNRYYGGWGLYTDEGSSHIVLENNLVYDCACEGFHQHYGRENIVRGNIFAFNRANGMAFTSDRYVNYAFPGQPHTRAVNFFGNVIVAGGKPFYRLDDPALFADNRLWSDCNFLHFPDESAVFAVLGNERNLSIAEWRKQGFDRHSENGNAGFVNAEKRDFRLKAESPLPAFGFIPWDYSKAGPRS